MKTDSDERPVQDGRTVKLRLSLPAIRWNAMSSAGIAALIAHDGLQGPIEICAVASLAGIGMCCETAVKIAQARTPAPRSS